MSNLTQIQTFIEVANSGSFSEVSRTESLPRSTISARVKALEARLNTRLLNRNTRHVSLTNEGFKYLEKCQQALKLLNEAEEGFSQASGLSGRIRISIPVALSAFSFSKLLMDFNQIHPELLIEIIVSDQVSDLVADNIDLAIRGRVPGDLDLISRPLGSSELYYFVSPIFLKQHKLTLKKLNSDSEILKEHLIFELGTRRSNMMLQTKDFNLAHALVCQGAGVAALPMTLCETEVKQNTLKVIDKRPRPSKLPLFLVYPNRQQAPARLKVFIDYILENKDVI